MKVLGIELKYPSTRELLEAAMLICIFSAIVVLAYYAGVVDSEDVPIIAIGGAVGVLSSTFGASILRHCWRALVLIAVIALFIHAVFTMMGVF